MDQLLLILRLFFNQLTSAVNTNIAADAEEAAKDTTTPGVEQTLFYVTGWSPGTTPSIALTAPSTISNNYIVTKIWVVPKSGTLTGSSSSNYLVVSTAASQGGTQLVYNGYGNTQNYLRTANVSIGNVVDIGIYLGYILNDINGPSGSPFNVPLLSSSTVLYAAVNGTGWDTGWLVDIFVQGMILPYGP
jgi:hypothetical protein